MVCLKNKPSPRIAIGTAALLAAALMVVGVVLMTTNLTSQNDGSRSSDSNAIDVVGEPSATIPSTPSATPSNTPSSVPSNAPTTLPTSPPTALPTIPPTTLPTVPPTVVPTSIPTTLAPTTSVPTAVPTMTTPLPVLMFPPNPVPSNPYAGYFNYDPTDSDYGPDEWGDVDTSNSYLKEFSNNGFGTWRGHLGERDPTKNRCDPRSRDFQSPIDLYQTVGEAEAVCDAPHQIRSRPANYGVSSTRLKKRIEPHKLSLVPDRRACLNVDLKECKTFRPPMADYPRYSSGMTHFSDLLNFDIKFPGEHWIEGESFDAEIQMLHTHLDSPRISAIGQPIRATADGFNADFQDILDQFEIAYQRDLAACNAKNTTTRRRAASTVNRDVAKEEKSHTEVEGQSSHLRSRSPSLQRKLQFSNQQFSNQTYDFNPYSEALMPTVYFFRYDGTYTDPPCVYLTWWVMSSPTIISFAQLSQAKRLLFTHVNGNCEMTSVHNAEQSVARPLQVQADDQYVMKCTEEEFVADKFK